MKTRNQRATNLGVYCTRMEFPMKVLVVSLALAFGFVTGCKQHDQAAPATESTSVTSGPFSSQELQQFVALDPIDAHAHAFQSDPAFYAFFKKLNLHMVNILVDRK